MKYASNLDYLMASIVYLGTHTYWWARSPKSMASELQLNEERLQRVFDGFPGLFRKSVRTDRETGQHYYALQARYAQKEGGDTKDPEQTSYIKPLSKDTLTVLIEFVSKTAENELSQSRATRTNFVAIGASIISAMAAIAAVFLSKFPVR